MRSRGLHVLLVLVPSLVGAGFINGRGPTKSVAAVKDEFFIISSVDIAKKQVVLKRPTEVTELMAVTDSTAFLDEQGKPLHFKDLRAGDTVFITSSSGGGGPRSVLRLRRAPMTVEELHRRYPQQ